MALTGHFLEKPSNTCDFHVFFWIVLPANLALSSGAGSALPLLQHQRE
jgi:hypothetical protein